MLYQSLCALKSKQNNFCNVNLCCVLINIHFHWSLSLVGVWRASLFFRGFLYVWSSVWGFSLWLSGNRWFELFNQLAFFFRSVRIQKNFNWYIDLRVELLVESKQEIDLWTGIPVEFRDSWSKIALLLCFCFVRLLNLFGSTSCGYKLVFYAWIFRPQVFLECLVRFWARFPVLFGNISLTSNPNLRMISTKEPC